MPLLPPPSPMQIDDEKKNAKMILWFIIIRRRTLNSNESAEKVGREWRDEKKTDIPARSLFYVGNGVSGILGENVSLIYNNT